MAKLLQKFRVQRQKALQFVAFVGTDIQCVTLRYASQRVPAPSATKALTDVPGLSSAVYKVPDGDVGPGASKGGQYKNPEYFCYNKMSYFEAEVELSKYRLPQPSNKSKRN